MKNKQVIKLGVILISTLFLALLSTQLVEANPPDPPPPTLVWQKREPIFPPPEGEAWSPEIAAQGLVRTFKTVADAEVRQRNPTTNYGIEPTMGAGYDNYTAERRLRHRSLLDFNVATFLPPGTVIHQATLRLYMVGYCDTGSTTYRAHRISSDWSEMGVTWNNQPPLAEGYGSRVIPAPSPWGWYTFNVTSLVQAWINGVYPEYGIMIQGPESPPYACAFRDFLTKGGGGVSSAPELIVDYTLPAPAINVSKNNVTFFHQCDTPGPIPQTIAVQSNDATLHNWTASVTGGSGWLNLGKTGGKTSFIFPDQLELSASQTTPCTGTRTAQIQLAATGLASKTVNVTFYQGDFHQIYLPVIFKNSDGGSVGSPSPRIILLIGVADYQNLPAPASFSVLSARQPNKTQDLMYSRADVGGMNNTMEMAFGPVGPSGSGSLIFLAEEFATKANVDYAIEYVDEREDADTEVLIYFSGHGGPVGVDANPVDELDGTDEMIGVYDTGFSPSLTNAVIDDDFKARLANLETEHLAVIFDTCHGGGMEVSQSHRAVLAASREDQGSWESAELEHGVFTYYMLQAMHTPAADTNGDCWISIQEIYSYVYNRVYNYIWAREGIAQNPYLDMTTDVKVIPVSGCSPP
ncbi:MAG: DNRLRE domain-containing protein [Anaerolineae bacterium]|nr:DNRLRE domain-containing protein [Anaerolineae bacterium]